MTSGDESAMETPGIDVMVLQALEADTSRELVPELVDVFVKSADTRRDQISADIAAGNLDGAAGQAHALKSSSATFGATGTSAIVEAMLLEGYTITISSVNSVTIISPPTRAPTNKP